MTLLSDPKQLSDRDLDCVLAERLFGWHFSGNRRGNWRLHQEEPRRPGDTSFGPYLVHERGHATWGAPNFSWWASTGDGMLAVEGELTKRGLVVTTFANGIICLATVERPHTVTRSTIGSAALHVSEGGNLPRAVAEAAYQALLGEENA